MEGSRPGKRRWWERLPISLNLRTLMVLVLITGGGLGWYAMKARRQARREWVIATIQGSGSSVELDGLGISRVVWSPAGSTHPASLPRRELTEDQLVALGECDRLRELVMVVGVMTDDGLAAVGRDAGLRRLYCFKPRITDAGLGSLAGLADLRSLELIRVPELTDACLAHLSGLTGLEEITLSGSKIDGSGLAHLAGMKRLRSLVIPDSQLDDARLSRLGRLVGLRKLYIGGGKYTDAGLAGLSGLAELRELGLGTEGCSEAGLAHLTGLPHLEVLNLGGRVTDAWLDRLGVMKSLREVYVEGTQLSDEAIARLHRVLPQVQIYVDGSVR